MNSKINPVKVYNEIYNLTKKQKKALDDKNFDKILEQIEKKDKLIEKTKSIEFNNLNNSVKDDIKKLLSKIKSLDKKNITRIELMKDDLKDKLQNNKKSKKVKKYMNKYSNFNKGIKG